MAQTLTQLILLARQKSDTESRSNVLDPEITAYLNEGVKQLYDLVLSVDPSYYFKADTDFSLASSPTGNVHTLPADFYKERLLVVFPDTSREMPVFVLNITERSRGKLGYTLEGNTIRVWPYQLAGQGPYRLYYVPKPTLLVSAGDTLDVTLDNFDEYPTTYAAIRISEKRRKPTDELGRDLQMAVERVNAMAGMRAGEPEQAAVLWRRGRTIDLESL